MDDINNIDEKIGRVTQAEFSRLLGKSEVYVHSLVDRGIVVKSDDGLIDVAAAVESMAVVADPGKHILAASADDTPLMRRIRERVLGGVVVVPDVAPTASPSDGSGAKYKTHPPGGYQEARTAREWQIARQASERADQIAMNNALQRAELVPAAVLTDTLARTGAEISVILDRIPITIRRMLPTLPSAELDIVRAAIAEARERITKMRLDLAPAPESEMGQDAKS